MSNDLMRDARKVTAGMFFAAVLLYLGYELTRAEVGEKPIFTFLIPTDEYNQLISDYHAGQLAVTDAQSLGRFYGRIVNVLRDARQRGGWDNPDYVHLQKQLSRTS